jgi:GTP-binding protein HflX
MYDTKEEPARAILVGVQLPDETDLQHVSSMEELERLVKTLGFQVLGSLSQKRKTPCAATFVGRGKLAWITHLIKDAQLGLDLDIDSWHDWEEPDEDDEGTHDGAHDAHLHEEWESEETDEEQEPRHKVVLVMNNEITPTQLRNLNQKTRVEVLDRTGVIIEIFSRHARSKEARLQVEIARLTYNAPRLRATRGTYDRQAGGIGAKGAGESARELDRRRIRDRIAELRHQLTSISKEEQQRRQRRNEAQTVALVGYTNAGKSSLMRKLTGGEMYVADKLFATLDTTVRVMVPETTPRILVSDTVGFIKQLPHDLVASFRSTLDEARYCALLLHVVDASDPNFREQLAVTKKVLWEMGVEQERHLVLNKCDRLTDDEQQGLALEFPKAFLMSAMIPEDIERLHEHIRVFFEGAIVDYVFRVPYAKSKLLDDIHTNTDVIDTGYDEKGAVLRVRAPERTIDRIQELLTGLN